MKTKLEKLEESYKQVKATGDKAAGEVAAIESKLQEMKTEAARIAAAGDVELYAEAKKRIDEQETILEVKKAVLKSCEKPSLKTAEVMEAWHQYADTAEHELNDMCKKYEKARAELCGQFLAVVKKQNEILQTQNRCYELSDDESARFNIDLSKYDFRNDQFYFFKTGLCDGDLNGAIGAVMINKRFSEQISKM